MTANEATTVRGRSIPAVAWLVAGLLLFAASVAMYWLVIASPTHPGLYAHSDEWVYRAAGSLVRVHPGLLYRTAFLGLPFQYPPFAALVFAALSPFSFGTWQIALVVIDLMLLPVIAFASLRICGRHGLRAAGVSLALAAVGLWLEPVFLTMDFGQLNLILLALIIVDLSLPDSSRWKGIGIGIAAAVKLTPLIFVPYLLASRRVRAGVVSVLTFATTVLIGFAVLPAASRDFWGRVVLGQRGDTYRIQNQSINGVLLRLLHSQPPARTLWLALAAVTLIAGLVTAVVASRRGQELLGIVVCGVTGLLVSPISWSHHWVWVVPALALMAGGAGRRDAVGPPSEGTSPYRRVARVLGGAAIVALFAQWPVLTRVGHVIAFATYGWLRFAPGNGKEYTWRGATLLLGNAYVIAGAMAIAGVGAYLWATRHSARAALAPSATGDHVRSAGPGRHAQQVAHGRRAGQRVLRSPAVSQESPAGTSPAAAAGSPAPPSPGGAEFTAMAKRQT